MLKKLLILFTAFCLLILNSKQVKSASFQGLSVFPANYEAGEADSIARFEYELYPGEIFNDSIRITNKSGKDATYRLFAADGKTTSDGAFALSGLNEEKTGLANWISLSEEEIFIPDGQEGLVDFTIKVPQDTEVGDHLGGEFLFLILIKIIKKRETTVLF